MKRFWLILLTLGLLTIFSTAAFAVDVKVSGEFYAAGVYWNKTSLTNDSGPSTAFYFQRLRLRTDFVVAPGLTLITRVDAMDRVAGASRSATTTTLAVDSAGTTAENENIAVDWAYVVYQSPIGIFSAGYMDDGSTGTIFGNSLAPAPRIKYSYTNGPVTLNLAYTKVKEQSYTAFNTITYSDADNDKYGIEGVYKWKDGLAGVNVNYYRYAENRPATSTTPNSKRTYYIFTPYVIAKVGVLALQAELNWATGKYTEYDSGTNEIKMDNLSGWIDATATFGPVYAGATFAYVSGDDPTTADKKEGGTLTGGRDWSPNLIMWNYDRAMRFGELASSATTGNGFGTSGMANAFLYQGRIGVKPTDKLDVMTSFSYANADKKPATNYVSDQYGYELDVTATYKLTNNLTYMLGAGYLWTGDYFKGTNTANNVQNEFVVINKLTLTF
ncbi:MAG: hypothetical protein AB2L12_10010 [Smithellaceae bacterium]